MKKILHWLFDWILRDWSWNIPPKNNIPKDFPGLIPYIKNYKPERPMQPVRLFYFPNFDYYEYKWNLEEHVLRIDEVELINKNWEHDRRSTSS